MDGHPTVPGAAAVGEGLSHPTMFPARSPASRCPPCFRSMCSHRSCDRAEVSVPGCPRGLGPAQADPWITTRGPGGFIPRTRGPPEPAQNAPAAPTTPCKRSWHWAPELVRTAAPDPAPEHSAWAPAGLPPAPAPWLAQPLVFQRCPEGRAVGRAV